MSVRDHDQSNIDKCSLTKVIIFVLAILLKSFESIGEKIIMSMSSSSSKDNSNNNDGVKVETEQLSLLLTFGVFVSMSFALVMHALVMYFGIPFPGYNHLIATATLNINSVIAVEQDNGMAENGSVGDVSYVVSNGIRKMINHTESDDTGMTQHTDSDADNTFGMRRYTDSNDTFDNSHTLIEEIDNMSTDTASLPLYPFGYIVANESKIMGQPLSVYFIIAIPTLLSGTATALTVAGLYYLDVSFYQMICNSNIVFVALMKHHVLKNYIHKFQWIGMFWIVVSIFIGGSCALLVDRMSIRSGDVTAADDDGVSVTETLIGVLLVIAGTILNAVCVLVEEKLMKSDVPVPPLLLIGIEGLWGVLLSIFVMFPVGYALPGTDHGSYENPFNTWSLLMSSRKIQLAFFIYTVGILFLEICTMLVILKLSSIWYSIQTIFAIAVSWAVDLFIFYFVNPKFGEGWTQYDYIQIAGIAVLVYGTAIYNAPNKGGLRLQGQVWAFGFDCSKEYSAIKIEQEQISGQGEGDDDEGEGDDDYNDMEEPLLSATQDENVVV